MPGTVRRPVSRMPPRAARPRRAPRASRAPATRSNGSALKPAAVELPGAGDLAVDEEGRASTAGSSCGRSAGGSARAAGRCGGRARAAWRPRSAAAAAAPACPGRGAGRPGTSSSSPPSSSRKRSVATRSSTGLSVGEAEAGEALDVLAARRAERGQVAADEVVHRVVGSGSGASGSQSAAAPNRSARRRSQVPDGGTRTRSSHRWIPRAAGLPISASTSLRGSAPPSSAARSVRAASAIASAPGSFHARSQSARRASRTATANGQ